MLVGGYAYWVSHPPSQYEAVFQAELQRQRQRLAARPGGSNAYQDPVLGPVLGGQPARGELSSGLNSQVFVVSGPCQIDTLLAARPDLLDLIHFTGLPGSWLDNLALLDCCLRLREEALDGLKPGQMKEPELKRLQGELAGSQWQAQDYVQAYAGSILDFPEKTPSPGGLFAFPGLAAREARLFKNDFIAQLERVRSGESYASLPGDQSPDWDWVCGRHGVLRSPFLHPVPDCHERFERVRRHQAFLHLLSGILLERAETGQWPISLEEMPKFKPLAELERKAVKYYALGDTLEVSWGDWSFKR